MERLDFVIFLRVLLACSSVISWQIHLFNASCGFQEYLSKNVSSKKFLGKHLAVKVVYFGYGLE